MQPRCCTNRKLAHACVGTCFAGVCGDSKGPIGSCLRGTPGQGRLVSMNTTVSSALRASLRVYKMQKTACTCCHLFLLLFVSLQMVLWQLPESCNRMLRKHFRCSTAGALCLGFEVFGFGYPDIWGGPPRAQISGLGDHSKCISPIPQNSLQFQNFADFDEFCGIGEMQVM